MSNANTTDNHAPLAGNRDPDKYRPCVGIVLFNKDGMVFLGQRLDHTAAWQMPQGGIDEGEDPEIAVFREMEEEIGTRNARVLGMLDEWLYYDLPDRLVNKLWDGRYLGQRQKWVALEFMGEDSEIILDADDRPEFGAWKWVPLADLLEYAAPFKRDVYSRIITAFEGFASKKDAD